MAEDAPKKRGRKKGVPNRSKRGLLSRLKREYGADFHPIMKMAENAVKLQKLVEDMAEENPDDKKGLMAAHKNTIDAWEKIAQYTEPKLKATEVKHTTMPKLRTIDLGGKPVIEHKTDEDIIDVEVVDERTADN